MFEETLSEYTALSLPSQTGLLAYTAQVSFAVQPVSALIRFTVNELMEQRLMVAVESIQAYNDAILLLETQKEQME